MSDFSIQSLINAEVGKEKKRKPQHWAPSKLGSCLCGVYLERLGLPPDTEFDERTLRVFSIGRFFEDWVVGLLKKTDLEFETQVEVNWPEYDAHGYADVVVRKPTPLVYELKSKNSRAFWYMDKQKEGPNKQHAMQLWFYLERLGIDEGRLLYLEKDTLSTLEYVIRRDDPSLREAVEGELKILVRASEAKLPPPPTLEGWQAKYCRWHKQCVSQAKYLTI